jgi:hypothetical protein
MALASSRCSAPTVAPCRMRHASSAVAPSSSGRHVPGQSLSRVCHAVNFSGGFSVHMKSLTRLCVPMATVPSASGSGGEGRQGEGESRSSVGSLKKQAQDSNQEVYDKLIDVFFKKKNSPEDWKKLIVYSSQWPTLSPGLFARLEQLANEGYDDDPDGQLELRRFKRRLEGVSDSMAAHKELLEKFRDSSSAEWEGLVARQRALMGPEFFEYIELRIRASVADSRRNENGSGDGDDGQDTPAMLEAEQLAALGTQLSVMVDAYDKVVADTEALDSASQNFADLLQADTMESAEAKLDELAATGKLDPALLLTMAKAYSSVKDTDITKEEVKDIMAHLYFKAKEKFASQAPAEARILKFLLSVQSESEQMALLDQAFQPGPEIATANEDYLTTTPDAMINTIENILMVYDSSANGAQARQTLEAAGQGQGPSSMANQAASLMNPEVIDNMRSLRDLIRKRY